MALLKVKRGPQMTKIERNDTDEGVVIRCTRKRKDNAPISTFRCVCLNLSLHSDTSEPLSPSA
eukprot:682493-Pelagomonas_calceolata.AAC.3